MSAWLGRVIRRLRDEAAAGEGSPRDRDLLRAFVARRDPAAFETIVRRHGPMVLGVCRRVLRDLRDAEDAFQAVFLVLVRRAGSVVPAERVGGWLHGVACRTALEARRLIARRRAREKQVAEPPHPTVAPAPHSADLAAVLDEELSRLPERLRLPVILCDLEGRTRREAALELGIPDGTLSNRLAAARQVLAGRLRRRGVTLGASALAALAGMAEAAPELFASTTRAVLAGSAAAVSPGVAALAEGVIRTMFLAKFRIITAVVLTVAVAGAGVWGVCWALSAGPAYVKQKAVEAPEKPKKEVAPEPILEKAVRAAGAIAATKDEDIRRKVNILVNIANRQEKSGDRTGAASTFQTALKAAATIENEVMRADAESHIGFYQAHAGLVKEAGKTVEGLKIEDKKQARRLEDLRNRIRVEMAARLAKDGDFKAALKAAESIPVRVWKIKPKDKGKEVERRDSMYRDTALKYVAEARLAAGKIPEALKAVAEMKSLAVRLYPMRDIIVARAKTDTAAAGKLLQTLRKEIEGSKEGLTRPVDRAMFLASAQAAIGDAAGALVWIEKLKSNEERANALLGLSIGLAERKIATSPRKR